MRLKNNKTYPAVAFTLFEVKNKLSATLIMSHDVNAESVVVSPHQDKSQEVNTSMNQVTADTRSTISTSVKLIFSPVNIFSLAASMPLDLA